jgi:putative phosphoesterase
MDFAAIAGTPPTHKESHVERVEARSAAFLSDIHGNVAAFGAVINELAGDPPDVVVLNGDITWGTFPTETVELIDRLRGVVGRVVTIRGNGDRAVLQLLAGTRELEIPRDHWMPAAHSPAAVEELRRAVFQVDVAIAGVGVVRACHGSPRADIETVTPATPLDRLAEATAGVDADILLTGHTHLQFHREVEGLRIRHSVNPGSVGIPYGVPRPGAYWLRMSEINPFDFRCTPYDLDAYLDRVESTDDPGRGRMAGYLRTPVPFEAIVADAEERVFAD